MDYASLVFGLWVGCSYGLLDPCKSVCTDDKDILYTSVLQAVKYGKPVLRALVLPDLYRDDLFPTLGIDPKHYICCKLPDDPVFPYRIVYGVYEDHWIYII